MTLNLEERHFCYLSCTIYNDGNINITDGVQVGLLVGVILLACCVNKTSYQGVLW